MKWRLLAILGIAAAALVVVFLLTDKPAEVEPQETRRRMWSFDMRDLRRVEIAVEGDRSEAWYRTEDRVWYFDQPELPRVDMDRWGGGVPHLLSGPGASRLISHDVSAESLEKYGLKQPRMTLHLEYGKEASTIETIDLVVGDQTLDKVSYYLRVAGTSTVYTVDYSWYDIMERLVLEPPYVHE